MSYNRNKREVRPTVRGRESQKASVLVMTIWVICILTIFALSLADIVSERIFFARNYRGRAQAYLAACSGVNQAIAVINKDTKDSNYDHRMEPWSNSAELFSHQTLDQAYFNISYVWGPRTTETEQADQVMFGMIDEESKINLNTASPALLEGLFKNACNLMPNEAQSIADAIIDWRDEDSDPRPKGVENNYYQSLPNGYPCKNKPFDCIEELLLVKDITDDIFRQVQNLITIYGEGRVNINTASGRVLQALGLSDTLADKLLEFRDGTDGTPFTEDDRYFVELGNIVSQLSQVHALTQDESQQLSNLVATNAILTKSNHFLIQVEGYIGTAESPENIRKITCIIKRNGKIMHWRE